jgi:hypothetical protein
MLMLRAAVEVHVPANSTRFFKARTSGKAWGEQMEFVGSNGILGAQRAVCTLMNGRTRVCIRNSTSNNLRCRKGEVMEYLKKVRNEPLLKREKVVERNEPVFKGEKLVEKNEPVLKGEQGMVRNEPLLVRMEVKDPLVRKRNGGERNEPVLRTEMREGKSRCSGRKKKFRSLPAT